MTLNIKPAADRILVKRNDIKQVSNGGIVLPDVDKQSRVRCFEGVVIAVGDGKRLENGERQPVELDIGDLVIFGKFNGTEVFGDDDLIMLHEHEILAKLATPVN